MSRALLTPQLDVIILGACPILLTAAAALWSDALTPQVALILVTLLSFPHFMGSYFVFYGMQGPWRQHWIIGFFLPLILLAVASLALTAPNSTQLLGHTSLILLYWHYAKQTFGISLWLGRLNGSPIQGQSRSLLLISCLLLGSLALLRAESGSASFAIFGIYLRPVEIPEVIVAASQYLAWAALALMTGLCLTKQARQGQHWLALLPVLALAMWSDPDLVSPAVLAVLPIFHGAQYLPFPLRVTYKYIKAQMPQYALLSFACLWLGLSLGGYWLFRILPISVSAWSPTLPLAAVVLITLNLHHYFVDSVLWRFHRTEIARRF